jgi:hypothetical protein
VHVHDQVAAALDEVFVETLQAFVAGSGKRGNGWHSSGTLVVFWAGARAAWLAASEELV